MMDWNQLDDRRFLFTHRCGAYFTMSMRNIVENMEKENSAGVNDLRCPLCFQQLFASENPESESLSRALTEFCKVYKALSEKLKKEYLTMIEIDPRKQHEMLITATEPFDMG